MVFDHWEEYKNTQISPRLLWECTLDDFDYDYMKLLVVERVIERGEIEHFYAAIRIYGGMENFKNIIKEFPDYLSLICSSVLLGNLKTAVILLHLKGLLFMMTFNLTSLLKCLLVLINGN